MPKGSKEYTMWVELRGATEKFSQDMNKAVGAVTKVERQLTGFAQNIQKIFHAALVVGGVAAIGKLATQLGKLAEQGEAAGSIAEGFHRLGGSSVEIEKARRAVLGMVDSYELMQIANRGLLANIPGWNQSFASIADLGARVADVLNKDTKESIEELTNAIVRGQAKALIPLGFTFTDTANKALVTAEAMKQLPAVLSRLNPATDSVANAQTAFNKALGEAVKEVGIAINENETLRTAWRELEIAVKAIDWKAIGDDIASMAAVIANLSNFVLPHLTSAFQGWAYEVDRLFGKGMSGQQKRLLDEIETLKEDLQDLDSWKPANVVAWMIGQHGSTKDSLVQQLEEKRKALLELTHAMNAFEGGPANRPNLLLGADPDTAVDTAKKVVRKVQEEQKLSQLEVSNDLYERQVEAYRRGVDEWQSLFENAITGVTFNLKDTLRQVAVGFAAEMAQAIIGPLGEIGGAKGIGGAIARGLMGQAVEGIGGKEGLLGALGISGGVGGLIGTFGMSGASAYAGSAPLLGPLTASGAFTPASGILGALGPWGVGGLAALGIGGAMFGSKLFGHGPKNPDTIARRKASEWIEGITGKNFVVGSSSKFNTESGFAALHKLDKEAQGIFMALGQSIKSTLGITEDITEQIATLLVENTGEGIDKAKAMWQSLGLNAEEVQQKIIEDMIKAGKTWLEIESILSQVDRLSTPGLDQKGDFVGAFQAIIDSNATGLQATNAVITNAIEAAEANFKTFDEWRKALSQHFDPAQVDIFFQALAQRGVTDFKTLQDASVRTAGAIISDMQALGFAFEDVTKKIQEAAVAVNSMTGGVSELPDNIGGTSIPKLARGGIVTRPTLAVVGDAGPEIVMPMARFSRIPSMSGRGGGQGITVHIDARGAGPGVERNLMRVMREISEQSVARGINQLVRVSSRGGRGGL